MHAAEGNPWRWAMPRRDTLTSGDHPYSVEDTGEVAQQRQEYVQPECPAQPHLQENPKGW